MTTNSVEETLTQRGGVYGDYVVQSALSVHIKNIFRTSPSWHLLSEYQQEALDMIAVKIARLLVGNPNYIDSWHDIAGYSSLVVKELEKRGKK